MSALHPAPRLPKSLSSRFPRGKPPAERFVDRTADARRRLHILACCTAAWTLLVIVAGGLVTSTGSGLSVPDWPLSFGRLMPPMVGGVFFEHGHRMVAATAGLLIVIQAVLASLVEPRPAVRRLAFAAVGAVIAQGLLGGLTVLLRLPPAVSIGHAALAQLTFCLTVSMAVLTSSEGVTPSPRVAEPTALSTPWFALLVTAMIYMQILLGAVVRHSGAGLSIPDFPLIFGSLLPSPEMLANKAVLLHFIHRVGAFLVALSVCGLGVHILTRFKAPELTRPVICLLALVVVQILLGGSVIWTARMVPATSAHVACGAVVLATSLILTLRTFARVSRA